MTPAASQGTGERADSRAGDVGQAEGEGQGKAQAGEMVESKAIDLMAALLASLPKRSEVEEAFREGYRQGAHVLGSGLAEDLAWNDSKARKREAARALATDSEGGA